MGNSTIFVVSATRRLDVARQLEMVLSSKLGSSFRVAVWDQEIGPGGMILDEVRRAVSAADFCIAIASADDLVRMSGSWTTIPRSNVVFELGLSIGILGPGRTFILYEDSGGTRLPSDLDGFVYVPYSSEEGRLERAVHLIAARIVKADPHERAIGRAITNSMNLAFRQLRDPVESYEHEAEYTEKLCHMLSNLAPGQRLWALCGGKNYRLPEVQRYLEANYDAAARGIHISRVFASPGPLGEDESTVILRHQETPNMSAYVIGSPHAARLFEQYNLPPDFGFAILCDHVMVHHGLGLRSERGGKLLTAEALVTAYERLFRKFVHVAGAPLPKTRPDAPQAQLLPSPNAPPTTGGGH